MTYVITKRLAFNMSLLHPIAFRMNTPAPVRSSNYRDLLRMFNTNIEGKYNLWIALTKIKGVGRRFAKAICQKSGIDPYMRAGEVTEE